MADIISLYADTLSAYDDMSLPSADVTLTSADIAFPYGFVMDKKYKGDQELERSNAQVLPWYKVI